MSQTLKIYQCNIFVYSDDGNWINPDTDKRFNFYTALITTIDFESAKIFALDIIKPQYETRIGKVFKITLTESGLETVNLAGQGATDIDDADRTPNKFVLFDEKEA